MIIARKGTKTTKKNEINCRVFKALYSTGSFQDSLAFLKAL